MEIGIDNFNIDNFNDYHKNLKQQEDIHQEPIYHYTNLDALINIVKTRTLWATNCEYTNDLLEIQNLERLFNNLLITENEKLQRFLNIQKPLISGLQVLRKKTYGNL